MQKCQVDYGHYAEKLLDNAEISDLCINYESEHATHVSSNLAQHVGFDEGQPAFSHALNCFPFSWDKSPLSKICFRFVALGDRHVAFLSIVISCHFHTMTTLCNHTKGQLSCLPILANDIMWPLHNIVQQLKTALLL